MPDKNCVLCTGDGGVPIWRGTELRVIRAEDEELPAFYRVIWAAHLPEFTDLSPLERRTCMDAVALVEEALRAQLQPDKINLAAFGNMVPHLHWHVIARWRGDAYWPHPVWAPKQRGTAPEVRAHAASRIAAVDTAIRDAFNARFGRGKIA